MEEQQEKWPQELAEVAEKLEAWAKKPNLSEKSVFSVCRMELLPILAKLDGAVTWLKWYAPALADDVMGLLNRVDELVMADQPGFAGLTESSGFQAKATAFQLADKLRRIAEVATTKTNSRAEPTDTEQDIKPIKESKSKRLSTESQSARTTALLSAASELNQIADNFENWAKKQNAKFIATDAATPPPAFTLAEVEDWVNTYLSKQRLIAVFFNHPNLSYNVNSGLSSFLTTESKEFHLIIDVFRLHMPAIATSLKELYDKFWEDVAYRIECYNRSKKVRQREQQGDILPSTLIGETADDISPESQPILFLDGTVTRLIRRLRHIAEIAQKDITPDKPAETEQKIPPAKRRGLWPRVKGLAKEFYGLTIERITKAWLDKYG